MLIILTVRPINPLNIGLIFLSSLYIYVCVYVYTYMSYERCHHRACGRDSPG